MRAMPGSENDSMYDLECLRLASDLRQLAKATLDPALKAHCLLMAKQLSREVEGPDEDLG